MEENNTITIRRLDPEKDRPLYEQVFAWERDYPRWLKDAEKSCGMSLEEFLVQDNRVDVGVFEPDLLGMVSINYRAPKVFEGHVWAKRGSSTESLINAIVCIREGLAEDLGMKAFYVWVAKRNRPIKMLCGMIGCALDGATVIDGESHGKPIEWQRMVWVSPSLTV